jgi:Arc/MetJ family transcription regulator
MSMDIDASLRLALALRAQPGAYAVLLASGASRSAGIPTGWEILEDLCLQLAEIQGADAGKDPTAWYASTYGRVAAYDEVLDALTGTSNERLALLRPYFEPTEQEVEQGLKVPTPAHHAVAQLAKRGAVKVILTLNFDRLTEKALDAASVPYVVAASPQAMAGMNPLHLQRCVVIKVHGDYLDPGLLNTPAELASYDPRTDALLDQVLDEYGLVTLGWSATWDTALRRAVERCPNRRFSWFWVTTGDLSTEAVHLVKLRAAEVVHSAADEFMVSVTDAVRSLLDIQTIDPRHVSIAVATAKRALGASEQGIRVHDMLRDELRRIEATLPLTRDRFDGSDVNKYGSEVAELEACAESLIALTAVCGYWGTSSTDRWWLARVAAYAEDRGRPTSGGSTALLNLARYPATLLAYAGGVAAVAAGRFDTLAAFEGLHATNRSTGQRIPCFNVIAATKILGGFYSASGRGPTGVQANDDPARHLKGVLRDGLTTHVLLSSDDYDTAHDLFVYLLTLAAQDRYVQSKSQGDEGRWELAPPHDFYALGNSGSWSQPKPKVSAIVAERALGWIAEPYGPIAAGMFGGQIDRMLIAQAQVDKLFAEQTKRF